MNNFSEHPYNRSMGKQKKAEITDSSQRVMTRSELAKHYHIAPATVTTWAKQGMPVTYIGKVKSVAKGARPRYILSQVNTWLSNLQSGVIW